MEFLPAAYFGNAYLMDGQSGLLPRHPSGPMNVTEDGLTEPTPFARGRTLVLAPEDPKHRITVREATGDNELMMFDGRTKAQNGCTWCAALFPHSAPARLLNGSSIYTASTAGCVIL